MTSHDHAWVELLRTDDELIELTSDATGRRDALLLERGDRVARGPVLDANGAITAGFVRAARAHVPDAMERVVSPIASAHATRTRGRW